MDDLKQAIKSSLGWLELANYTANPADTNANRCGLCFVSNVLKYWNGSSWAAVSSSGGGVSSWDEVYDLDKTLTIDDTTLTFNLNKAAINGLTMAGTGLATGALLLFSNSGSGNDVTGTSSTWSVSAAGAAVFTAITGCDTLTAAANLAIDATGAGTVTIAGTSTGAVTVGTTLVVTGSAGSNSITLTGGDVSMGDGSLTITDADNASTVAVTNNTITTANLIAVTSTSLTTGNGFLMTANGLTEGNMVSLVTTAAGMTTGTFFSCNDGSARFAIKADGATAITTGVNSTKALEITGIQTSENLVTLTSSGVTADDKAIILINSSGNSASGSNQIRVAPTGTPVEGSIGIEFVGASKLMQAMCIDGDSVDNSVVKINGGGALASDKAVLEVSNDGNLASGGNLARFTIGGTPNAAAIGIEVVGAGKALTALSVDADPTASSVVKINGGGAMTDGIGVLELTNDGNLATGGNILVITMGGTPHTAACALEVTAAKDAKAVQITTSAATESAVTITGAGAIADNKALLHVVGSGTPAAAGSNLVRFEFTGTATNKPIIAELVGTGKNVSGLYSVTDNTTTHGVSIAGAGDLNAASMLKVTNTGTPAANTDTVVNFTFGGTATNNPIVCQIDNGTADALPLYVNSNVASATRACALIKQDSSTGATVCLELSQDDDDIGFMKFTGTVGSGKSIDTDDKSGGTAKYAKVLIGSDAYYIKLTPGS